MPHIKTFGNAGLWHITESEEELFHALTLPVPPAITHPVKRCEWLASRLLTKTLLQQRGLSFKGIVHNENNKPFLVDCDIAISLTHSSPYVAVQLAAINVGIDLEKPKEKLRYVAPRFLSKEEFLHANNDLTALCIYWCAKEAIYKWYSHGGLNFANEIFIEEFVIAKKGVLHAVIKPLQKKMQLHYVMDNDYVLAFID